MKRLLTLLLFSNLLLSLLQAQPVHQIRGTVIEKNSRQPLEFINVMVLGLNKGGVTNAEGHFTIEQVPPRKDNKEAWDNIDIFGWMGYPMEIKVNFLCRDSILAAPIALDLVLFSDLAMRAGMCGIQTWLSFFCKSPMHDFEHQPEHDLFTQWRMVKQTLRNMIGEKEPDYLA